MSTKALFILKGPWSRCKLGSALRGRPLLAVELLFGPPPRPPSCGAGVSSVRCARMNCRRVWSLRLALVVGMGALAGGCAPKSGDHCTVSTDCSVSGDRLCDTTQPGGYCTMFNCEPDRCPDEAACVAFNEISCSSSAVSTRFQRTFCMAVCDEDDDCRAGYKCFGSDPGRQIIDTAPSSRGVCTVPPSSPPVTSIDLPVCGTPDASFPSPDAGADMAAPPDATEAGADGAGDAGSDAEEASTDAAADGTD